MIYSTSATLLNIRKTPKIISSNILGKLPKNTLVEKLKEHSKDWWQVKTKNYNQGISGYVHSTFLTKFDSQPPVEYNVVELMNITEAHLSASSGIVSRFNQRWAFKLNENSLPFRKLTSKQVKIDSILNIVEFLDVENSFRYSPKTNATYCNIYAYDFSFLCGCYIPRVWWDAKSIIEISKGNSVTPIYGKTVFEQNANSIHDWFLSYGKEFAWKRSFDLNELQNSANEGKVVIIVAAQKNANLSGHITAVVPENGLHKATRHASGEVLKPLQSQAGRVNRKYFNQNWWLSSNYRDFGFWIHD